MKSIFKNAKAFDQEVKSWPNWEGKDLEWEVLDTGSASASEDEEDSEEDISSEEQPSDPSDGD